MAKGSDLPTHTRSALVGELASLEQRGDQDDTAKRRAGEVRDQLKDGGLSADDVKKALSEHRGRDAR